ncbi:sugar transporter-domain-containing protein [Xylariaceae sp. FL0255]|nr:sugar transporter-domain-containing protein [Xylariaceae sp. FL0255]
MADSRSYTLNHPLGIYAPASPRRTSNMALSTRPSTISTAQNPYHSQVRRRRHNQQAIIENPLTHLSEEEISIEVREFRSNCKLTEVNPNQLMRAALVAKDIKSYDAVARSEDPNAGRHLPVQLTEREKTALKSEIDSLPSEPAMWIVILTVSLAAFLQGFVQSSFNGASLYAAQFGISDMQSSPGNWELGITNASPFLFAALLGCPLALPINNYIGRRGAMAVAASLIIISSLGAAWCTRWYELFAVRILNGIGMGLKAVSTPILASEASTGYWRGTSILAWQLWVAFGIAASLSVNLIFSTINNESTSADASRLPLQFILGAPVVPAIVLLISLYFCPESPRYYMQQRSYHFDPSKAYCIMKRLRREEIQALRDIFLIYKSVQQEEDLDRPDDELKDHEIPRGFVEHFKAYAAQYKQLFIKRRLRNALISSSIVALAQQLCGINVFAFYSGSLFQSIFHTDGSHSPLTPMLYSLGYGLVNFLFGLPAIKTIDTLGRRKWLVITLPLMAIFLAAAALSTIASDPHVRGGLIALFALLFAAVYSPGMGPIPFTLAAESFPLSHREAGCAFAIATNLFFAGLLAAFFPSIEGGLGDAGTLGLFGGFNLIAFVLVFLFVEETKRRSLEDLDLVFAVEKLKFTQFQLKQYLPWFFRHYVLGRDVTRPELYLDYIWGDHAKDPIANDDYTPKAGRENVAGGDNGNDDKIEEGSWQHVENGNPHASANPLGLLENGIDLGDGRRMSAGSLDTNHW